MSMLMLIFVFFSLLLASFVLVAMITRSSPVEKMIGKRVSSVGSASKSGPAKTVAQQLLKESEVKRFASIDHALAKFGFSVMLQKRIKQADSSTTVTNVLIYSGVLSTAGGTLTWFFVPVPLLAVGVGALLAWLPFLYLSFRASRRLSAFNNVLAECIDMLARALRAGHSTLGAIEMLSQNAQEPAASAFKEIFKQQNLGMPLREALLELLDRFPSQDLRVLVTAILVQKDTGGNLAEILDRTAFVIRERLRIQGEIRVQTSQGRLTGWILTALPVVMLFLINMINPGYSTILLHDPTGRKLIYASVGMLAVGGFLIRRIVNGIEV